MIIIGFDPGSRYCGYGLLQIESRKVLAAGCDVIDVTRGKTLALRLKSLYENIMQILEEYHPEIAAVESIFFHRQVRSVFTLGHSRGVILLALAMTDIPVVEYSPREIKKSVCGNGNASKQQVRYMINQLYPLKESPKRDDAFDALAVATCHYNRMKWLQ
ncbi:MAG TPA: crossover junction endodeoxyribonuclease RuvC [Candidatus Cloacimonas acidaminovorans]|nr:crossover junction endodeoxyribonuclease RuvC [Candidatus Cloacimonas acidaminovorans]HRS61048.1 crossover junction endodeoxyribonuclease RuvC [Candidatus Cloacimonas sp.]HOM79118.1 crossover junction endodeoxyribonuclease RuvC [Candidatus Cloacimonas acidaminovorans]HOS07023.1 crossover junction endodeoxyribonuclease RuvC [Candidatus Cloacimonas acidaminovorans]HOT38773.1 crossover junction endodeoxyribonuclease RuvC [Candidatus Cloacimonas acidaminovorans]